MDELITLDSPLIDQVFKFEFLKLVIADAYRRRVFFKYEKRIRLRSPPEKVLIFGFFGLK